MSRQFWILVLASWLVAGGFIAIAGWAAAAIVAGVILIWLTVSGAFG